MSRPDTSRAPLSAQEVRRKHFNVRLRGYDQHEVHAFVRAIADDIEGLQAQITTLMEESRQLYSQLEEERADPKEAATDQAVSVLNQAQQLADSLIDEAMQSARDLLLTARSQQRDIMEQASTSAKGAVARATATIERASSQDPAFQDVEYIRMFARVAQVQFRAVLDALNEQVNRLTEVPEIAEPANSDQPSEAWDRQGSADEPFGTSPNGPHADSGKLGHRQ
jgi:cell division initiation protein